MSPRPMSRDSSSSTAGRAPSAPLTASAAPSRGYYLTFRRASDDSIVARVPVRPVEPVRPSRQSTQGRGG